MVYSLKVPLVSIKRFKLMPHLYLFLIVVLNEDRIDDMLVDLAPMPIVIDLLNGYNCFSLVNIVQVAVIDYLLRR